jgi:hypothetical protein
MYHAQCILDWLERRSNTDCPCCRQPLVSEDAVWEEVETSRKAKQKLAKRERKKSHCWRFASLTAELSVSHNNNGSNRGDLERADRSANHSPREGQGAILVLPSAAEDSRRETAENEECDHSDNTANHSHPESTSSDHSSSFDPHNEATISTTVAVVTAAASGFDSLPEEEAARTDSSQTDGASSTAATVDVIRQTTLGGRLAVEAGKATAK